MIELSANASGRGIGLAALVAALFVAGCAGVASAPQVRLGQASRDASKAPPRSATYPTNEKLLFVSENYATGHVGVYLAKSIARNKEPVAEITDATSGPYGLALDGAGTLYVANNAGSTVTEYPKGQTTHSVTITNGISNPLGLAVDRNGTLYVSNYPPAITEYAPGATSPKKTISGGGLNYAFGVALDKHQNLYVADFISDQVWEVPKGTTTLKALNLQDLSEPLGLAFDANGNLWVTDGSADKVNVYPPGSTAPSKTITSPFTRPYAIGSDAHGDIAISNLSGPDSEIYAFKPGKYSPYADLTKSITAPTGLLLAKP